MKDSELPDLLNSFHRRYGSWRAVQDSKEIYGLVNFATLRAYANGREVKNRKHRRLFDLPNKVETLPCPECGSAPTVCLCDGKRVVKSVPYGTKPRRPRLAIAKDDMESAERSIQNNLPPEQVAELTRRLLKRQELEY